MSDSDGAGGAGGVPAAHVCQRLCDQFALVTGTDSACAQCLLQNHDWSLQRALDAYFSALSSSTDIGNSVALSLPARASLTTAPPARLSVISWNVDGLDSRNLKMRTKAVCRTVQSELPDVLMLQELVPCTLAYIRDKLTQYECVAPAAELANDYFTAILLRKFRVYRDSERLLPFAGSQMDRHLLLVRAHVGRVPLALFTTHLESCAESSGERMRQLAECWRQVGAMAEEGAVALLGGDMNLRDAELRRCGSVPNSVLDVWQATGSPQYARFTWDSERNTNIQLGSARFKPRLRFDRVYVSRDRRLQPEYFGLVGIKKIASTQCFPSDHWGVRANFQLNHEPNGL